ncbi:hypothetical protein C3942_06755 [Solimonas fluminis]|uniref:Big-1 domain-containing protein n=2 Tax=Solimonas fluminis TaxID=2086571 RepID=A0A2S5THN3_9GAMM|nr:hypothetical protein C3942_06755 [Solimonas fluminis]
MGVLNGSTFTAGAIEIGTTPVAAGGSTTLRVNIVDTANGNALVTSLVEVSFSSPCTSNDRASIDTPAFATAGQASVTYRALGCSGSDVVRATAVVNGTTVVAQGTVTVQPSPISSLQFDSATPTAIRLRGAGQPETSAVRFRALNSAGGPVANVDVTFSLDTTVGGITLNPTTGKTDSNGYVQTTVRSGTVATSVRVTAETGLPNVPPAQSDSLVISTGLADQDSFSLSVGCFNIEGGDYDGTTTNVNIRAADRFNNPVPDGTAVAFRAEGGAIQPQCLTTDGACSVTFTSQQPRVANRRVTILATAIGEESFTDVNGDGRYDAGEPFADLDEAFVDNDEDGVRDTNEPFLDFNNNGSFTTGSGNFTGVLCDSGCDTATSLHVRDSQRIIMSGSAATILISPSPIDLSNGAVGVNVLVSDSVGQPMPGQTTVTATTSLGSIVGDSTYIQPCTSVGAPYPYNFAIQPPDGLDEPRSGIFTIKVTTPRGVVSTQTATVTFTPDPEPPLPPPGPLNSISFVSATPTTIGIKGTGLNEVSELVFQVRTTNGGPLPNQTVTFTPNTVVGGIQLEPTSAVTDANGRVVTRLRAGTVQTTVRVTATASQINSGVETKVSTVSSNLTITTGLPDQDSVSLSLSTHNPEAWTRDGTPVTATIRAADRFNNPAPDGTAFAFRTNGGSIVGSCLIENGTCSATWRSQNPRRARSQVLAYAIGEESFVDLNGNGIYDTGEPFEDLPEPWLDNDLDGIYDAGSEEFVDFNSNGVRDDSNGLFTGTLCAGAGCDTRKSLYVFDTETLVMSDSRPVIDINPPTADIVVSGGSFVLEDGTVPTVTIPTRAGTGGTVAFRVVVRDVNDQPMPSGTTITLANDGGDVTITPVDSFVVPDTIDDTAEGNTYSWTIVDEAYVPGDQLGALTLRVVSPSGIDTRYELRLRLDDVTPP